MVTNFTLGGVEKTIYYYLVLVMLFSVTAVVVVGPRTLLVYYISLIFVKEGIDLFLRMS